MSQNARYTTPRSRGPHLTPTCHRLFPWPAPMNASAWTTRSGTPWQIWLGTLEAYTRMRNSTALLKSRPRAYMKARSTGVVICPFQRCVNCHPTVDVSATVHLTCGETPGNQPLASACYLEQTGEDKTRVT